jgi:cobalt-zinc-cadmium efflux system membrane fusion protein
LPKLSASTRQRLRSLDRTRWLAVIAVVAVLAVVVPWSVTRWRANSVAHDGVGENRLDAPAEPTLVRVTPEKIAAAGLHATPVKAADVQETRRVPGRFGYNASRRLEVKLPAAGVVKQVLAMPGATVKQGDKLAVLTSLEAGMARDDVTRCETNVHLAGHDADRDKEIETNLLSLLKLLESRPDVSTIEDEFKGRTLGSFREQIMAAYSKRMLAEKVWKSTEEMMANGAVAERLVQERESDREVVVAHFQGVCEQARFDAHHAQVRSQADLEHAERVLSVSRQKLAMLIGPDADIASSADDEAGICELILRSPLSGVVESRFVSEGVQVTPSQPLFAIADTDTLWVSAQIYEQEWAAIGGANIQEVRVESPALPGESVPARVQFTGVGTSSETHAISLVAEVSNASRRFKPGMFAWIDVPLGPKHRGLVAPAGAVMRHDGETFAFVEEQEGQYRKTPVTLGVTTAEQVELTSGVSEGQRVIDRGAFILKSEMLLESEPD